jgi:hypothetical protein
VASIIVLVRQWKEGMRTGLVKTTVKRTVATRYGFSCELCGYAWVWRTDQPRPPVTVRPDLIAAGNQRLEAEAERRREEDEWVQQAAALQQWQKSQKGK